LAVLPQRTARSVSVILDDGPALSAAESKDQHAEVGEPHAPGIALPPGRHGARILVTTGREILTAYVPNPRGAAFMTVIEKTFGTSLTTRSWETVRKCVVA